MFFFFFRRMITYVLSCFHYLMIILFYFLLRSVFIIQVITHAFFASCLNTREFFIPKPSITLLKIVQKLIQPHSVKSSQLYFIRQTKTNKKLKKNLLAKGFNYTIKHIKCNKKKSYIKKSFWGAWPLWSTPRLLSFHLVQKTNEIFHL